MIVEDYVEPGSSATDDRRPAFQEMIDTALARPPAFSTWSTASPVTLSSMLRTALPLAMRSAIKESISGIEDLQTFVEVADAGGVSAAARRLGISKSIVSRRLIRLEADVGVQLVARTIRGAALTESDALFRDYAARACLEIDTAGLGAPDAYRDGASRTRLLMRYVTSKRPLPNGGFAERRSIVGPSRALIRLQTS